MSAGAVPRERPELHYRLLTAAIGLPVLAVVVQIGGWSFAIVAGIIALLAGAEFVHGWLIPKLPLSAAWAMAPMFGAASIMVMGAHAAWQFVAVGAAFALATFLIGLSRSDVFGPRRPYRVVAACLVYIGILLSTMVLLRDVEHGRNWVVLALLATFAVDTGAYTVGKLVGRHKMAPRISPGKTWEGAAGGYLAGFRAVIGLDALFDPEIAFAKIAVLAALLPVAAICGDLLESWMKRRMGVKDASGLLPGHGGFLDRLDSILFTTPLVYVFVRLAVE